MVSCAVDDALLIEMVTAALAQQPPMECPHETLRFAEHHRIPQHGYGPGATREEILDAPGPGREMTGSTVVSSQGASPVSRGD